MSSKQGEAYRSPVGAEVLFYNDPSVDEPLVTEVYEFTDDSGNKFNVCDVPNIFLTEAKKIKVRIPSKVMSLYGEVHSIIGQREKYFEVEAAEKPADYVYEETPTEGSTSASVSEEEVVKIVNNYFTEDYEGVPNDEIIALLSDD